MSKSVYLAGPVRNLDDGGAGWRTRVEKVFVPHYKILNPLDKYNIPASDVEIVDEFVSKSEDSRVSVHNLVKNDKDMIDECDILFVGHFDVQMIGTPMEVMYAFERDIPVVIWDAEGTGSNNMSPWFRKHSEIIESDLQSLAIGMGTV